MFQRTPEEVAARKAHRETVAAAYQASANALLGKLIGRTIVGYHPEFEQDGQQLAAVHLHLDDGRTVTLAYWAQHADESGFEAVIDGERIERPKIPYTGPVSDAERAINNVWARAVAANLNRPSFFR